MHKIKWFTQVEEISLKFEMVYTCETAWGTWNQV